MIYTGDADAPIKYKELGLGCVIIKIIYTKSVKKDLKKIDKKYHKVIKGKIEELAKYPDMRSIKKLVHHYLADYSLKVGDYRVLFDIDENSNTISVLKIGHRVIVKSKTSLQLIANGDSR